MMPAAPDSPPVPIRYWIFGVGGAGFLAGFLVVLAFIVLVEVGVSALFALIAIVLGAIYVSGKRRTTMKKENGR